jgi:phospholipid-binding lipoprotein MlaA
MTRLISNSDAPLGLVRWCVLLCLVVLAGCASSPQKVNPTDPWENYNREMTKFNDGIDRAIFKPVATVYRDLVPMVVRHGVGNFFDNLGDVWNGINSVFQLRPQAAAESFLRFGVNTAFGLGGLLDVADEMGIERHQEDFGKTLGRWGVPSGPYLVLPFLGSSTLRDGLAMSANSKGDMVLRISDVPSRNSIYALRVVDTRASFLKLEGFVNDIALDKYSFTRDAFLQKRRAEIYRPGQEDELEKPKDFDKEDEKSDKK